MKQLKLWCPIFVSLYLIFLIASFNFHSFNADWAVYLSEVICAGPSKVRNCSLSAPLDLVEILRSPLSDPLQVYDFGIRFMSASFGGFLAQFSDVDDSLATGLLKIHIIKSLIVAYITTVSFYLLSRFPNVKRFGYELIICVFTFPYTIFMASSVYTASIATIALMQILIIIKIFEVENHLSPRVIWLLLGHYVAASILILTNRFETTIFYIFAITLFCLRLWKHFEKRLYVKLIYPLTLGIFGVFLLQNRVLRYMLGAASRQDLKILNSETAESSVVVDQVGEIGLTLTALVTLFDNSSRNLYSATVVPGTTAEYLAKLLVVISWIPLISLFALKLFSLFRQLLENSSSKRILFAENYPTLSVLFLFLLIPVYTRTIWFLHYVIPLLSVFLLFTDSSGNSPGLYRKLLGLGMLSNALTIYVVSLKNGPIYINEHIFGVELQIVIATAASILLLAILRYKALLVRN